MSNTGPNTEVKWGTIHTHTWKMMSNTGPNTGVKWGTIHTRTWKMRYNTHTYMKNAQNTIYISISINILFFYWQIKTKENKNNKYVSKENLPFTAASLTSTPIYIYNFEIQWERYIACCHLLRCLYNILYILWIWYILRHPIHYITNCWVRLLSNYNIKYICTIYTRLEIQCMSYVYL